MHEPSGLSLRTSPRLSELSDVYRSVKSVTLSSSSAAIATTSSLRKCTNPGMRQQQPQCLHLKSDFSASFIVSILILAVLSFGSIRHRREQRWDGKAEAQAEEYPKQGMPKYGQPFCFRMPQGDKFEPLCEFCSTVTATHVFHVTRRELHPTLWAHSP